MAIERIGVVGAGQMGGGIAQVAAEKGIPFLSLRAISDGPRAPIPFNLGEVMDENANLHVVRMLKAIARRPGTVLQFGRLSRNSRIAADNALAYGMAAGVVAFVILTLAANLLAAVLSMIANPIPSSAMRAATCRASVLTATL